MEYKYEDESQGVSDDGPDGSQNGAREEPAVRASVETAIEQQDGHFDRAGTQEEEKLGNPAILAKFSVKRSMAAMKGRGTSINGASSEGLTSHM